MILNRIIFFVSMLVVIPTFIIACGGTAANSMGFERYHHTVTLMPDGKALVVGGLDSKGIGIGNGEIYDPSLDSWSPTGIMVTPRGNHSSELLSDGRVIAVAGKSSQVRMAGSAEVYDPSSNSWNWLAGDGTTRDRFGSVLLPDGKILISGGYASHRKSYGTKLDTSVVEVFDVTSTKFSEVSPMTHAKRDHTSLLLSDGRVIVMGGLVDDTVDGPKRDTLASTEIYDPESDSWSLGAVMAQGRGLHTATTLLDGKILVIGGVNTARQTINSAELYDPTTDSWAPAASMSQTRDGHTGTLLSDGRVLVVGGNGTSGGLSLTSAEIYDPSSNSWSSAGNMLEGRSHHTAIQLNDGKVLIAGGLLGPESPLSTVDFYSPTTNSWSSAITNTQ